MKSQRFMKRTSLRIDACIVEALRLGLSAESGTVSMNWKIVSNPYSPESCAILATRSLLRLLKVEVEYFVTIIDCDSIISPEAT